MGNASDAAGLATAGRRAFRGCSTRWWPSIGRSHTAPVRPRKTGCHACACSLTAVCQQPLPAHLNSYRHFLRFGEAMLDKIAGWRGELRFRTRCGFAPGAEEALSNRTPGGKLLLASHLGDVEACRSAGAIAGRSGH